MRVVDCFTDVILFARRMARSEAEEISCEEAKKVFTTLIIESEKTANEYEIAAEIFESAKFPVVAYVDEILLCSKWPEKTLWQKEPLQRIYFNTTNAGSEFYDRLYELNKFGPDRDVREVYGLCLGLGFRGKYFRGEDRKKYEEIKAFNLNLLLPDEAQKNIDSSTLFPSAYKQHGRDYTSSFKARMSIYPVVIGVPVLVITAMLLAFHFYIGSTLDQIHELIKF